MRGYVQKPKSFEMRCDCRCLRERVERGENPHYTKLHEATPNFINFLL
ncbi:hypothetical protein [Archaeoglobus fulgidus]|nr:hypothetical protein [Archaeoglobus fulgidus]